MRPAILPVFLPGILWRAVLLLGIIHWYARKILEACIRDAPNKPLHLDTRLNTSLHIMKGQVRMLITSPGSNVLTQSAQISEVVFAVWASVAVLVFPSVGVYPTHVGIIEDPVVNVASGCPAVTIAVFEVHDHGGEFGVPAVAAQALDVSGEVVAFVLLSSQSQRYSHFRLIQR
jgi:hypothetical protein